MSEKESPIPQLLYIASWPLFDGHWTVASYAREPGEPLAEESWLYDTYDGWATTQITGEVAVWIEHYADRLLRHLENVSAQGRLL